MKRKTLPSRMLLFVKEVIKSFLRTLFSTLAGAKSYQLFALPSGLTTEFEGKKCEVGLQDHTEHCQANTLEKECHPEMRSYPKAPLPGLYFLEGGMATNLGGQLNASNHLITTYLQSIDRKTAHQHDLFRFSISRFRPRIYKGSEKIATLTTGWQGNFYHWMFEVLPRFAIYQEAGVEVEKYFIESRAPFQKESLDLLGIAPEKIINAAEYHAVSAPKICVSSIPPQPTSWGCRFLKESMRAHLKKEAGRAKRIYISRNDAPRRRVLNEEELFSMLQRYGFEKVVLTNHSFKEQMNIFHNAEWIVAPHGAGLSNLVFTESNSQLLELFAPPYVVVCYWILANVVGVKYHYLFSEPREDVNPLDPDLYMDISKTEQSIKNFFL